MPIPPQDRPLESLREEAIDRLVVNYGRGRLSREAFERRLDEALDAHTHEAVLATSSDLDLDVDARYERAKAAERAPAAAAAGAADRIFNVFSGTHRRGPWPVPAEVHIFNVFGGCELDFTEARFAARVTRLRVFSLFGGATLLVSDGMSVTSSALCVFGNIDNRSGAPADGSTPAIEIEGLLMFSGAAVKIKRTLREHWLRFADAIKSSLGAAR